jgi:hypothetical protein
MAFDERDAVTASREFRCSCEADDAGADDECVK